MDKDLLLIRYGEIALKKSATRRIFERKLIKNIKNVFKKNNLDCKISQEWGRIYLYTDDLSKGADLLKKIFGIVSFSPAWKISIGNIDSLADKTVSFVKKLIDNDSSFAVRVRRVGNHKFTSQDVAVKAGDEIRKTTGGNVDLDNPEIEVFIEIREKKGFIFTEKINGVGGLPFDTQGRVLALIDSSYSMLAAWMLMKRGCNVVFAAKDDFMKKKLEVFLSKWFIPLEKSVFLIEGKDKESFLSEGTVEGIKEKIGRKKFEGVVTGEHISGSENIDFFSAVGFPVFQPLIGLDENEIDRKCREIGIES